MGTLVAVLLVGLAVYAAACVVAGSRRHAGTVGSFRGGIGPIERHFEEPPDRVLAAYRAAATRAPGMSVLDGDASTLLVDMRPTVRVLGGIYGLAIRVRVDARGERGSTVLVDAEKKVPFAWSTAHESHVALVHAERSLRMAAKGSGVVELV